MFLKRLRTKAADAMTATAFHDFVLACGPVPLVVLEEELDARLAVSP